MKKIALAVNVTLASLVMLCGTALAEPTRLTLFSTDSTCLQHGGTGTATPGYVSVKQSAPVDFSQYPVTHNPVSVSGRVALEQANISAIYEVYLANNDGCSTFADLGTLNTNPHGDGIMHFTKTEIPDNVFCWFFVVQGTYSRFVSGAEC
jgi:hypothetical protein